MLNRKTGASINVFLNVTLTQAGISNPDLMKENSHQ